MLQIGSLVLYFLLLVLGIPLDISLNTGYKQRGFFETLPEKGFEFVPSRGSSTVAFNLSLVLLSAEIDSVTKE